MSEASPWRRHFLALRPDASAAARLLAVPVDPEARRVPAVDLHATLVFLDTLDADGEIRALAAATAAATHVSEPLVVHLTRVERWPSVWVACADEVASHSGVARLAHALATELAARGFATETRAFREHVTLARTRGAASRRAPFVPPGLDVAFPASEILLMASRAGGGDPGGPRYEIRGRVPLPRA